MPVAKETLDDLALSEKEYEAIVDRLGRTPNLLELGMFGSLWSEHCGYKHSKALLRLFPSDSPNLLVPPGQENAGVLELEDDLCLVFKIESHNHPSAVEPFQGAATGVGGIVRDILAMGARPIALLNSLRFGPLTTERDRSLFRGVVGGISWYGNCIGVPNVGGETVFSPAYAGNPLVNAMCIGLARRDDLTFSGATGVGNPIFLVGADTGRDGIHGASGLASRVLEQERELRSAVQVGNPFLEKVLIEACLEMAADGVLAGMQDLGAAGLTSSVVESAAKGAGGAELELGNVLRRERGMTPYEVMLSESQERMLLIVRAGEEARVEAVLDKWDLPFTVVGRVTDDGNVRIKEGGQSVADLPVVPLTDPPLYRLQGIAPDYLEETRAFDFESLPLPEDGPGELLLRLLVSPNIASKRWIFRQYDHQVQTNTAQGPGGDAAVLRLRETRKGLAIATDGNGRYTYLDPHQGGAIAVAEACRNVSCVGARPLAITDCLNFGNPENLQVYHQLEQAIRGMAEACRALGVPVVSGNVSLYNEVDGRAIFPTPIVGAVGVLEDAAVHCQAAFRREGDMVLLLGAALVTGEAAALGGSEYLEVVHGVVAGTPTIDLDLEARLQRCLQEAIAEGLLSSAHDCSDGGLAVALAESAVQGGLGFGGGFPIEGRWDAAFFGEAASRVVVSLAAADAPRFQRLAADRGVPLANLGVVGGARFTIGDRIDLSLAALSDAWEGGLERALTGAG